MKHILSAPLKLYMRIAEPRVIRMLLFVIYLGMGYAGCRVMNAVPHSLEGLIGFELVVMLGIFLAVGGLFSALAVLPGIWWLERVGIIAIWTGLGMYAILVIRLDSSPLGVAVSTMFVLFFLIRFMEIKSRQLAPRKE